MSWVLALVLGVVSARRPIAWTDSGFVEGVEMKTYNGRTIYAYFGIPYTENPIGRRFRELKPAESWSGVRDAGSHPPICTQKWRNNPVTGSENCLFIHVYTPLSEPGNESLPVIVYIHGGGYYFFGAHLNGPRYILDLNVIFVSFSYRIGALGFLSSGDAALPGNLGYKDQVLALEWIKKNIRNFGGNPNSVTLHGMSSGASSVNAHFYSPQSRGLFHRAYLTGGTIMMPWAIQEDPQQLFKSVAQGLNCKGDSYDIVACLEKQTAEDLAKEIYKVHDAPSGVTIGTVVDYMSPNPFLLESPFESLYAKRVYDVPVIYVNVYNEGTYPGVPYLDNPELLKEMNDNWTSIAPKLLYLQNKVPPEEMESVVKKIRNFYFQDKLIDLNSGQDLIKMISDRCYLMGAMKTTTMHARVSSNVYQGIYNYKASHTTSVAFTPTQGTARFDFRPSHTDDLVVMFNLSTHYEIEQNPKDMEMVAAMTRMLVNFAKTGVPTFDSGAEWLPVKRHTRHEGPIRLLHINSPDDMKMVNEYNVGNVKFWNTIPMNEPFSGQII